MIQLMGRFLYDWELTIATVHMYTRNEKCCWKVSIAIDYECFLKFFTDMIVYFVSGEFWVKWFVIQIALVNKKAEKFQTWEICFEMFWKSWLVQFEKKKQERKDYSITQQLCNGMFRPIKIKITQLMNMNGILILLLIKPNQTDSINEK